MAYFELFSDGATGDPTFVTGVGAANQFELIRDTALSDKNLTGINVGYSVQAFAGFTTTVEGNIVNPQISTAFAMIAGDPSCDPTFFCHTAGNKGPQYVRASVINDTDPNTLLNIGYMRQTLLGFSQDNESSIANPKFFTNYDSVASYGNIDPIFFNEVKKITDFQNVGGVGFHRVFAVDNTGGISTVLGVASATLSPITQTASVTVQIIGQGAMTLLGFAQTAAVVERMTGTASQTLPGFTQEADALAFIPAVIDQTFPGFAQVQEDAEAAETFVGASDQTMPGFIQEADATVEFAGAIDQTLPGFIQEADAYTFVAAIDQTLPGFIQEADVAVEFVATADQTLFGIAQEADAELGFPAVIDQTLPGFAQAAEATLELSAAVDQTLRGFSQEADTTVDNPAVPVFGAIAITFQGFSQRGVAHIIVPAPEHEGERGRGGGSAPKEIPPHEWEVDLFRAKEYRRNFDMAVPPVVIANATLGSIASPPPRPASVPLPPFVKPR